MEETVDQSDKQWDKFLWCCLQKFRLNVMVVRSPVVAEPSNSRQNFLCRKIATEEGSGIARNLLTAKSKQVAN